MMITVDRTQGFARDHGEFWGPNSDTPRKIIVDMNLDENAGVEFAYSVGGKTFILGVPIERLRRLIL